MELKKTKLLRMNLQTFAEQNEPNETTEETTEGADGNVTVEEPENNPEEKSFTQAELDKIIADRLARAEKKREEAVQKERDEAERKRLEEAQEYKTLAEQYKSELETLKLDAVKAKKESLLTQAGYSGEQVALLSKLVDGDTDEDMAESIETLKSTVPPKPKYVDPSAGNGNRDKPEQTDLEDEGKSLYQRLKAKGKIK